MQKRAENECFGNVVEFSLLDWSDILYSDRQEQYSSTNDNEDVWKGH